MLIEPDPAQLTARLTQAAQAWSPGVRVSSVRRLTHGASSLTYLADTTHERLSSIVVKVAPSGLAPTLHRDILRQARLLRSLAVRHDVPTPEVLFADAGDEHDGSLFAMAHCTGEVFEPNVDTMPDPAPSAQDIHGRVLHAARILAALHSPRSLPDWIGEEQAVSLSDEIERWDRAFATLPREFGLDWAPRSEALRAAMPAPHPARLTHGDFRLGNMLCSGPSVSAIIDWEIWARADCRLDLGWFLLTLDAAHPAAVRVWSGIPTSADIVAAYTAAGGTVLERPNWFLAVALYKFVATTGLIGKNALKRGESDGWGALMIPRLPYALKRIDELLNVE
jgi:aminoglycoside phosphotransferase (APT) family kinase protein